MVLHIPADEVKQIRDVFHRGPTALPALNKLSHQALMVAFLSKPVQHHQGAGRTASVFRGLLICFKMGEDVERFVADHVIVVIEHIVAGVGMIGDSPERGSTVLVQIRRIFLRVSDDVLLRQSLFVVRHTARLLFIHYIRLTATKVQQNVGHCVALLLHLP